MMLDRPSSVTRATRLAVCVSTVALVWLVPAATLASAEGKGPTEKGQSCAEAVAYSAKLGKGERKRREQEARQEALTNLAEAVWTDSFGETGRTSAQTRDEKVLASLLSRYEVKDRLAGGESRLQGTRRERSVVYCVPSSLYESVQTELKRQRQQAIQELRRRFARLERLLAKERLDVASEELTTLEIDVVSEALEEVEYRSVLDGSSRSFYWWLEDWSDLVEKGPEFVEYMLERAERFIEQGHLEEADRYLHEARQADRDDERARELERLIQKRRIERVVLLREAEALAERGRFAAARKRLGEAKDIDSDDVLPLEETTKTIAGLRAAFHQYNPRRSIRLVTGFGTLGIDTGEVENRVRSSTGFDVNGSAPLNVNVGANFMIDRQFFASVSGGFGLSEDRNHTAFGRRIVLYQIYQLTAGVGYRTLQSASRRFGFEVSTGTVWERAAVNDIYDSPLDESDSQAGLYLGLAAQVGRTLLSLRQGLGFEDSEESLVGWSENLQFNVGVSF